VFEPLEYVPGTTKDAKIVNEEIAKMNRTLKKLSDAFDDAGEITN
jgi:hypothetical protein